jgi:hypothetical protein
MIARLRRIAAVLAFGSLLLATGCIYVVVQKDGGKSCSHCRRPRSAPPAMEQPARPEPGTAPAESPAENE